MIDKGHRVEIISGKYEGHLGWVRDVTMSGYLVELSWPTDGKLVFPGWRLKRV